MVMHTNDRRMTLLDERLRLMFATQVQVPRFFRRRGGLKALTPLGWFAFLSLAAIVVGGALALAT